MMCNNLAHFAPNFVVDTASYIVKEQNKTQRAPWVGLSMAHFISSAPDNA